MTTIPRVARSGLRPGGPSAAQQRADAECEKPAALGVTGIAGLSETEQGLNELNMRQGWDRQ